MLNIFKVSMQNMADSFYYIVDLGRWLVLHNQYAWVISYLLLQVKWLEELYFAVSVHNMTNSL